MSKADQIDIVLNQVTAAVVCAYLEHMNTAIEIELGIEAYQGKIPAFISPSE